MGGQRSKIRSTRAKKIVTSAYGRRGGSGQWMMEPRHEPGMCEATPLTSSAHQQLSRAHEHTRAPIQFDSRHERRQNEMAFDVTTLHTARCASGRLEERAASAYMHHHCMLRDARARLRFMTCSHLKECTHSIARAWDTEATAKLTLCRRRQFGCTALTWASWQQAQLKLLR